MNQQELELQLNQYDEAYFHATPLVSDTVYDNMVDQYQLLYGKYTPNSTKNISGITHLKVKLPKYSPSLDKIKLLSDFNLFKSRHQGPYVVMDKLDGCTLILYYHDNIINILSHSTDGIHGSDLSHLLPYMDFPKNIDHILIRGELVINRKVFKEKYADIYENERNMISVIHAKTVKYDVIRDLEFKAFEIQSSQENILDQLKKLKELGFKVVDYRIEEDLDFDAITDELKNGFCENLRDGKVIASLDIENVVEGLPKHKIAFKTIGDIMETKVIEVEWNISMHMRLKPRVKVEEIFLEGGHVNWVNGINADFIFKNDIGPGTTLLLSRDITPKIYQVIQGTKASLPEHYIWDESHTDIMGVMDDQVYIKRIYRFFDLLEAKNLGLKTIDKLYQSGFTTIQLVLDLTVEQLIKVPGIKTKGAIRILEAIKLCKVNIDLVKVMAASCLFPNFAEKKLQQILNHTPTLTKVMLDLCDNHLTVQDIQTVPGIKDTADIFIDNIDNFKLFLETMPTVKEILMAKEIKSQDIDMIEIVNEDDYEYITTPPLLIPETKSLILSGMVIVFSGDKKCTSIAKTLGAIVDQGVTKNTTLLVVDQVGAMNAKEKRCLKDKIPIMSLADFKAKYIL